MENKKIVESIIKHLLRTLKKHNLFTKFIEALYGSNMFFSYGSTQCSFANMQNFVSEILNTLQKNMSQKQIAAIANPKFDVIMFTINHILQHTLDKQQNMKKVLGIRPEIVGEEVFNNVCLELYGNEFSLFLQNMKKVNPKQCRQRS